MEFSVKLATLPEGLSFPERFSERLKFDASRGVLSYRGFMTKCAYDELYGLSSEPEYHRALEQLFVLTSGEVVPNDSRKLTPTLLMATVAAMIVAAALVWGAVRNASAGRAVDSSPTATAANGS